MVSAAGNAAIQNNSYDENASPPHVETSGQNRRVLLVDDDPSLLLSLKRRLQKKFDLTLAKNGDQALTAIDDEGDFAVVVSDFKMPGMNGVDLLSVAKDRAPGTLRLLYTGYADKKIAMNALNKSGVFKILEKPCDTDDLSEAIEAAIIEYNSALYDASDTHDSTILEQVCENLLSNVNHEFRTPLNHINLVATMLEEGLVKAYEVSEYASLVRESGNQILRLVETMTDCARLSDETKRPECKPVRLDELLVGVLEDVKESARAKGVGLHLRRCDDPTVIDADIDMIRPALSAIVDNAIRFNRLGGEVCVSLARLNDSFIVQVSDTELAELPNSATPAIGPVAHNDDAPTPAPDILSLGLATAKSAIERHGGSMAIWADAECGTSVIVTLPIHSGLVDLH